MGRLWPVTEELADPSWDGTSLWVFDLTADLIFKLHLAGSPPASATKCRGSGNPGGRGAAGVTYPRSRGVHT